MNATEQNEENDRLAVGTIQRIYMPDHIRRKDISQQKQKSRKKRPGGRFLLLFIREFEAVVLLFVFDLEGEAEEECEDAEGSKDNHRHKVSVGSHT